MPELIACPSCGCKVQTNEAMLGRSTRCIACGQGFVASTEPAAREEEPEEPVYRLRRDPELDAPPRDRSPLERRMPLCPRCHRPVAWEADACPHCCHLLDARDREGPTWQRRRDGEEHRGALIDKLGTLALLASVLGPMTAGAGLLIAFAAGLSAVLMANNDLALMRRNEMNPDGEAATEAGRNKAIVGLVLAVVFSVVFVLIIVAILL